MSRKNRPYKRGEAFRDAIKFVIACEGAERERQYFEHIATDPRRLELVILSPQNVQNVQKNAELSGSSPKWVMNRLVKYLDEHDIEVKKTGDIVWLVLDIDRWPLDDLIELTEVCKAKQWGIALSNPCFEVWLYLHVKEMAESPDTSCKSFKTILGELELGTLKGYNVVRYLENVHLALERAERQPDNPLDPIPARTTTRVHRVVQQLLKL